MAPKPGNLNPDSKAGNARLGTGRGSNAGRSQASGANKAVPKPKKLGPPAGTMKRIATKGFTKSEIDEFTAFANKYYANQARLRAKFGKGQ